MTATGFILDAVSGQRVTVEYDASYSDGSVTVSGVVQTVERGLWVVLERDDGRIIKVFGREVADRESGDVALDGHRVGELLGYELEDDTDDSA